MANKKKNAKQAKSSKQAEKRARQASRPDGVANPEELEPFVKKPEESTTGTAEAGDRLLQVVIETPKGSRNKYSWSEEQRCFLLKAALPAGMVFPYDFGFVPQTKAEDGDPIDVLVLMDEPAFPGCALMARLIGVIEGEQTSPKTAPVRNDRLVAVAETAHAYANFRKLRDMPEQTLREIEEFFVNYHRLQGKRFKLLGNKGERTALELIEKARSHAAK
jgi:inorganic pyrophosphatase